MPNVFEPSFDETSERAGFTSRRARLGRQAGADRLGASVYELPPGQSPWPYHAHLSNEELLIVLSGRPHLREPAGWRQLDEGELVSFRTGERGAHQVQNRTDEPVRILIVSEMNAPEISLYPDSGKVGVLERAPGSRGEGLELWLPREEGLDYWEREEPPPRP